MDKLNDKINSSLISNNLSKKNISFNKSIYSLNNSCDCRQCKIKKSKTLSVDSKKVKKKYNDIADKYHFSFVKTNTRKSKFSKTNKPPPLKLFRKSHRAGSAKIRKKSTNKKIKKSNNSKLKIPKLNKKKFRKKTIGSTLNPNISNDEDFEESSGNNSLTQSVINEEDKITKERSKEKKQIEYQQLLHNNYTNNNQKMKFKDMIACKEIQRKIRRSIVNLKIDDLKKKCMK